MSSIITSPTFCHRRCSEYRLIFPAFVAELRSNRTLDPFMQMAIDEARLGLAEGGIPIGSVLVVDGCVVGRGHNRRVQRGSAILHAEMDCLENAGRLAARDYTKIGRAHV